MLQDFKECANWCIAVEKLVKGAAQNKLSQGNNCIPTTNGSGIYYSLIKLNCVTITFGQNSNSCVSPFQKLQCDSCVNNLESAVMGIYCDTSNCLHSDTRALWHKFIYHWFHKVSSSVQNLSM